MANLFEDGFEDWTDVTKSGYAQTGNGQVPSLANGRFGSNGLGIAGNVPWRYVVGTKTEIWQGGALYLNTASVTVHHLFAAMSGATLIVGLDVTGTGAIAATRAGAALGTSAGGVFPFNAWNHVVVRVVLGTSTGICQVWVNGALVLNLSSINTAAGFAAYDSIGMLADNFLVARLDDWWATDGENLGDCRIFSLFPDGNSATAGENDGVIGGTSPAATKWQSVNEVNADDGAKLVALTAVGTQLFTLTNLPAGVVGTVKGVGVYNRVQKTDAGVCDYQNALKPTTVQLGPQTGASASWVTTVPTRYRTNPDTGADFTVAEVNAALAGVKRAA